MLFFVTTRSHIAVCCAWRFAQRKNGDDDDDLGFSKSGRTYLLFRIRQWRFAFPCSYKTAEIKQVMFPVKLHRQSFII